MTSKSEQPVQRLHTFGEWQVGPSDWADLRFLLAVAERGSFQGAARAERVAVNTVRAHVARLEGRLGATLLRRTRTGSEPSEAGVRLLAVAREMQASARDAPLQSRGDRLLTAGEVRIGCSEGLGLLWLTPRLGRLTDRLDGLTANLLFDYDLDHDRSRQSDLALTFSRPGDPEMIVTKLATIHFMGFASAGYLREHGTPRTLDDVRRHRLVEQVTPGVKSWLADLLLGTDRRPEAVAVRTNSSLAQLWAVANGAGIAAMPTYVRATTSSVIALDPPLNLRFDLYCTYHPSARGAPAVMATMEWLRECFEATDQPWFTSEFVHPNEFRQSIDGKVISLFDGLAPAGSAKLNSTEATRAESRKKGPKATLR